MLMLLWASVKEKRGYTVNMRRSGRCHVLEEKEKERKKKRKKEREKTLETEESMESIEGN